MRSSIQIHGFFQMKMFQLINNKLVLIEEYKHKNKIVNNGKELLCKLLANDGTDNYIRRIGFGTGTGDPDVSNTGLTNSFLVLTSGSTYPTTTSINFTWELGLAENNGVTITEYGLFSSDNTLFSRITRSGIEKKSDIVLSGDWTITFT